MTTAALKAAIPDPPHPNAVWLTIDETAGYLRRCRRSIEKLRRADPTFAALVTLVTGGSPRISRKRLDAWLESRPTGWSTRGGGKRAFGREGK